MKLKTELTAFGQEIFEKRYAYPGEKTWADCAYRVAKHISSAEKDEEKEKWFQKFYETVGSGDFIPGGRILFGSGRNGGQQNLLNCYIQAPQSDTVEGIGQLIKDCYQISCGGGGIGINFSTIRPKGDDIQNIKNSAPGPVSVIKMVNEIGNHVKAGKNRRVALLGILNVDHPDLFEFLSVKLDKNELTNFNISVGIIDDFVEAIEKDEEWVFKFNNRKYSLYQLTRVSFDGKEETVELTALSEEDALGRANEHYKKDWRDTFKNPKKGTIKAKKVWDIIFENSIEAGCPGIFNLGLNKRASNVSYFAEVVAPNPCIIGNTIVGCADGFPDRTIRELAEKGNDVPVYCADKKGRVTIRTMRSPRKTGDKMPVFKITFDGGDSIVTTSDHKWVMKDGSIKETKNLLYGDSLEGMSKIQAKFSEILPYLKATKSQDYLWLKKGGKVRAEHRLIAEYYYNKVVSNGEVVHHIDFDALNNNPSNLQIMRKIDHDKLHAECMIGDKNPMRRATIEWSKEKWDDYKQKMSKVKSAEGNGRYSGYTNEQLVEFAVELTKTLGRRASVGEWKKFAKENGLPISFSKWRKNHLNGVIGLLKNAAIRCGFDKIDLDPRVAKTFSKLIDYGYDCSIKNNEVYINKTCEYCEKEFSNHHSLKEISYCSINCAIKVINNNSELRAYSTEMRKESLKKRKIADAEKQLSVYTKLKLDFGRDPWKKEWEHACRDLGIRFRLGKFSPFKTYEDLKKEALSYNHRVKSVEFYGYEDVYNGTVDEFHNFFVGGFSNKNNPKEKFYLLNLQCGEIPAEKGANCCLGHVNLSNMVENGEVDWKRLANAVRTGIRFLDNVLTVNHFPIPECKEVGQNSRRIGLGVTGLAYMLIKLGLRYGSEKSLEFIERLFTTIRDEAYKTSVYLARDKSAFPAFDSKKYLNSEFIKTLPARIRMLIKEHGIRNAVMLTTAPCGTISIVHGTSTGIEPIFSAMYMRRYRDANVIKEQLIVDPLFEQHIKEKKSLDVFVGAYDVSPEEHLKVQATVQRYLDQSVSKTINLPENTKAEDVCDISLQYLPYLKGMTIYKAGSKGQEPLQAIPLTEENINKYISQVDKATSVIDENSVSCKIGGECGA